MILSPHELSSSLGTGGCSTKLSAREPLHPESAAGTGEQDASCCDQVSSSSNAGGNAVTYASVLQFSSHEERPIKNYNDRGGGGQHNLNPLASEFRPASSGAGASIISGDSSKSRSNNNWRNKHESGSGQSDLPTSKSNKKRKSQARRDRWLALNKSNELKKIYRAFNNGAKRFYRKLKATHEDLRTASAPTQRESLGLGIGKIDREHAKVNDNDSAETDR